MSSTPLNLKTAKGSEKVLLYNDQDFKRIRDSVGLSEQILVEFDFERGLAPGGGKGGDLLGLTKDQRFLIKEVKDSDQVSLELYAKSYADHVTSTTHDSLLPLFYLHFQRASTGKNFVVMNNFLPSPKALKFPGREGVPGAVDGEKVVGWDLKFDLKGCRDDKTQEKAGKKIEEVHKRFFKFWMYCGCGISEERRVYAQGKVDAYEYQLHLTKEQATHVQNMIRNDAEWCAANDLMDHSLIVGILSYPISHLEQEKDIKKLFPESPVRGQPFLSVRDGRLWAVYLGVIDFLQLWNCTKKVAHVIKLCCAPKPMSTVNPDAYREQFEVLADRIVGDAEQFDASDDDSQMFTADNREDLSTFAFRADWGEDEEDEADAVCNANWEDQNRAGCYCIGSLAEGQQL